MAMDRQMGQIEADSRTRQYFEGVGFEIGDMKNQPEYILQCQIAEFLRRQYPRVRFLSDVRAALKLTIPQQVRAKKIQADDFACPDMMIFQPSGDWHGMFLELKAESPYRRDGRLKTDDHLERQHKSITILADLGYHADFYWTFEQAEKAIREYLNA